MLSKLRVELIQPKSKRRTLHLIHRYEFKGNKRNWLGVKCQRFRCRFCDREIYKLEGR